MRTLWLVLEEELAASKGIDLCWLAYLAPETARRWREDNRPAVYAMHAAIVSKR